MTLQEWLELIKYQSLSLECSLILFFRPGDWSSMAHVAPMLPGHFGLRSRGDLSCVADSMEAMQVMSLCAIAGMNELELDPILPSLVKHRSCHSWHA